MNIYIYVQTYIYIFMFKNIYLCSKINIYFQKNIDCQIYIFMFKNIYSGLVRHVLLAISNRTQASLLAGDWSSRTPAIVINYLKK